MVFVELGLFSKLEARGDWIQLVIIIILIKDTNTKYKRKPNWEAIIFEKNYP